MKIHGLCFGRGTNSVCWLGTSERRGMQEKPSGGLLRVVALCPGIGKMGRGRNIGTVRVCVLSWHIHHQNHLPFFFFFFTLSYINPSLNLSVSIYQSIPFFGAFQSQFQSSMQFKANFSHQCNCTPKTF